ncbi:DUF4199 domain-containing protein [uncultured Chitinophaga sp.]|uniref:DUF4199 domain-containing protein n=1 Tax=uncultured Chitinophaga sp. TaxID=339340 RepID=UPI0025E24132|nr:DUF4199 domain-containing protein [uncultured Chitinophaga sp.]
MNTKIHVRYGLIFAAIDILLFVVFYNVNHQLPSFFFLMAVALLLIAAVVISCFQYTKLTSDKLTVGNIFSNGFRTVAVVTVVFGLAVVIFTKTMPGFKEKMLTEASENARKADPTLTDKDIKENQALLEQRLTASSLAGIIFPQLILGTIAAGITAFALKKQ